MLRRLMIGLALAGCDDGGTTPLHTSDAAAADGATAADAARLDASAPDAAPPDAGRLDAARPDAAGPDAARLDAAPGDAAADAARADAARADAAPVDAGAGADAGPPEPDLGVADPDMAIEVDAGGGPDAEPPPPPPNHGLDDFPFTCADPAWRPAPCGPGLGEFHESIGAQHVPDNVDIPPYELSPPSSGPHRGQWARWGQYISLPPERWLHNLEHGGIAVLYHPCAPAETIQALRDLVRARPEGDGLLYVMTPYPDLQGTVALVAWEWTYQAACVQRDELNLFFDRYHAMGPEAVAAHGGYVEGWIGP